MVFFVILLVCVLFLRFPISPCIPPILLVVGLAMQSIALFGVADTQRFRRIVLLGSSGACASTRFDTIVSQILFVNVLRA